jgi:hypothetical protein
LREGDIVASVLNIQVLDDEIDDKIDNRPGYLPIKGGYLFKFSTKGKKWSRTKTDYWYTFI